MQDVLHIFWQTGLVVENFLFNVPALCPKPQFSNFEEK